MWRYLIPGAVFALLVAVFAVGLYRDPGYVPSPLIGKPAPQFSLPRLDDPQMTLQRSDLLGKVSLVNVWGTWCSGCRQEHETLLTLAQDGSIPIYGINWKDDPALARQWLQQLGNPYAAVGVDEAGGAAIEWGVYGMPETFVVDGTGRIAYKHVGPISKESLEDKVIPAIEQARKAGSATPATVKP